MSTVSVWMTPYGRHNIPEAIIWLAEQAEHKATGRWMWRGAMPQATFPDLYETVWFKVIEEWGKWREAKDEAEYKNRLTVQKTSDINLAT